MDRVAIAEVTYAKSRLPFSERYFSNFIFSFSFRVSRSNDLERIGDEAEDFVGDLLAAGRSRWSAIFLT